MGYYTKNSDKKSGDGLSITEWNDLSSAVAGDSGLTLALTPEDKVGIGTDDPDAKLAINGGLHVGGDSNPGEYNLLVDGTLTVGGNATVNNAFMGDVGHGDTWAGFGHSSAASRESYGLLQHSNGQRTLINKKSGDGYIGFRVDNRNKMVMLDNGNFGIGTDNPDAKLAINGGLHVGGNSDPGDNNLAVAGKVGIGTDDPEQTLTVKGTWNSGKSASSNLTFGGNLAIISDRPQIDFIDTNNNDWSIYVNSNKMFFVREPWSTNDLVLDGAGNVGIGTSSPNAKLEVSGDVKATRFIGDGSQLTNLTVGVTGLNLATTNNSTVGIGTTRARAKLAVNGGLHVGGDSDPGDNNLLVDGTLEVIGELIVRNGIKMVQSNGRSFKISVDNNGALVIWHNELRDGWFLAAGADYELKRGWSNSFG
jgi:hypothetical protein